MIRRASWTFSKRKLPIATQKKSPDEKECLQNIAIELNNVAVDLYENNELIHSKEMYKNAVDVILTMIHQNDDRVLEVGDERIRLIEEVIKGKRWLHHGASSCARILDTMLECYQWSDPECSSCVTPVFICKPIKIDASCKEESDVRNLVNAAIISYNMGLVYLKQREFSKSEEIFEWGISLMQKIDDGNETLYKSMVFANLLNNLGCIHYQSANTFEAETYYMHAFQISKEVFERSKGEMLYKSQRCISAVFYNIGVTKAHLGVYKEASVAFNWCLMMQKRALGNNNMVIACVETNIGNVYFQKGRMNDAMKAFLHALRVTMLIKGNNHPDTGRLLFHLGNVHKVRCEYKEALQVYKKTLSIERANFGRHHIEIIATLCEIGNIYFLTNDLDNAISAFDEALKIAKANSEWKRENPMMIDILFQLIKLNVESGRTDEANKCQRELMNELCDLGYDKISNKMFEIALMLNFIERPPAAAAA